MAEKDPEVITLKDGASTSEFGLVRTMVILGGVLELTSGVLEQLQNSGLLSAGGKAQSGVTIALVVIGGLLQIASVLGYTRSRQALKTTHMQATAAAVIAAASSEVAVPVVVQPPAPPSPR
jgi:hypothetical protein